MSKIIKPNCQKCYYTAYLICYHIKEDKNGKIHRQWKKNYKKKHGVNPPLELDKRKQRRLARKMARQINKTLQTAAETLTAAINS